MGEPIEDLHEVRTVVTGPAGRLDVLVTWPSEDPGAVGILVCSPSPLLGGDLENNVTEAIAHRAAAAGLAAVRFDYRNSGASDDTTGGLPRAEWWHELEQDGAFDAVLDDARAVLRYAGRLFRPVSVVGYSFGGWVATRLAEESAALRCAAICPPLSRLDFSGLGRSADTFLAVAGADALDPAPPRAEIVRRHPGVELLLLDGADHFLLGDEARAVDPALAFVLRGAASESTA